MVMARQERFWSGHLFERTQFKRTVGIHEPHSHAWRTERCQPSTSAGIYARLTSLRLRGGLVKTEVATRHLGRSRSRVKMNTTIQQLGSADVGHLALPILFVLITIIIVIDTLMTRQKIKFVRLHQYKVCTRCTYDLSRSEPEGKCPECGTAFCHEELVRHWTAWIAERSTATGE